MDDNNNEGKTSTATSAEVETQINDQEQKEEATNPLKTVLENINNKKSGKTQLEKALHSRKKIDEEIERLRKESGEVYDEEEDNRPVTYKDLRQMEVSNGQKKAIEMAYTIEDPIERDLVIHHINHSIKLSGNGETDLLHARAIVNEIKNRNIVEEAQRGSSYTKTTHNSGGGAPAKSDSNKVTLTAEEEYAMRAYGLTEAQVIEARKKSVASGN